MNALEEFDDLDPQSVAGAECVAFVSDNQTHSVVSNVAKQFYSNPIVRDGDTSDALSFLSDAIPPRILVVDLGDNNQPLDTMLSLTTAFSEDTRLIGIGEVNDIELYREMTGAGVTDYLVKPVSEATLSAAFERAQQVTPTSGEAASTDPKDQKRIVIMGARGGVGASTIAVNLAWLFAEEHKKNTSLIDLDLEFGTIALSLDLEPTRGLREALEDPGRIDSLFIASATAKINQRLSIMATEEALSGEITYSKDAIEVLFETVARDNECIVVDLPRPAFGMRHQTLAAATDIILVTELSLPGLRDTIRLLGNVEEAAPNKPILVIANHVGGAQQAMRQADFQKALGRKVDIVIPDEPKAFNDSANTGKPLVHCAKKSKASKSFHDIASKIIGKPSKKSKDEKPKKSWGGLIKRSD